MFTNVHNCFQLNAQICLNQGENRILARKAFVEDVFQNSKCNRPKIPKSSNRIVLSRSMLVLTSIWIVIDPLIMEDRLIESPDGFVVRFLIWASIIVRG